MTVAEELATYAPEEAAKLRALAVAMNACYDLATHVTIEDGNLDDEHIDMALADPELTEEGRGLLNTLRAMPLEARDLAWEISAGREASTGGERLADVRMRLLGR